MLHITALIVAMILTSASFAQESEDSSPTVTVSGSNQVSGSYGTIMYDPHKPVEGTGDYLTDYLDFDVGIKNFFVRGTFLVNSPSVGYNPFPEIFNEFFHRRTVGFRSKYLNIEGGHFKTAFGKGLTLNLRENRKTEKNYVLDGAYLTSDLPWLTIQGLAGRSPEKKFKKIDLINISNEFDSIFAMLEDVNYRDNIMGTYIESFYPFSHIPALSFMSASSWGGGMVYYGNDVKVPGSIKVVDSTGTITKVVTYQNRNAVYLPSWFLNLSFENFDISYENALMFYRKYEFIDTLVSEEITQKYYSYSGYLSLGISFWDFYFSGEYKNYFYARKKGFGPYAFNSPGFAVVNQWVEAPDARQKHGWHLLTKHTLNRTMDDDLGYNATLNWSRDRTTLLTNFSIGANHIVNDDSTRYSFFRLDDNTRYWESYTEWEQNFTDWIYTKLGISIGIIDPLDPNFLNRTIGAKALFGPFAGKHSFELSVEAQYNTKDYEYETDSTKDVISQDVYNLFVKPSYSLSPYLTVFFAGEREPELYFNYTEAKQEKELDINYYFSGGITFSIENHTLSFEAGSMSGRMECNPPPCVYIQSFKGIKVTLNSIF